MFTIWWLPTACVTPNPLTLLFHVFNSESHTSTHSNFEYAVLPFSQPVQKKEIWFKDASFSSPNLPIFYCFGFSILEVQSSSVFIFLLIKSLPAPAFAVGFALPFWRIGSFPVFFFSSQWILKWTFRVLPHLGL